MPRPRNDSADPDRSLVARALDGEPEAYEALFARYHGMVAHIARRSACPWPDSDDMVQEVFLHVHRSLPSFRGESRFSTWLYRLAQNVVRMQLRRARCRPRFAPLAPEDDACGVDHVTPESLLENAERARALSRLLDTLSEKKRHVFVMHDLLGVPKSRIADALCVPPVTVRTRLHYARRELYASLDREPALRGIAPRTGAPAR